jgi:hypothetical protein
MTDIAKAVAFATHCLKWTDVAAATDGSRVLGTKQGQTFSFNPDSTSDLDRLLRDFLGNRLLIQTGRGTTSLFQWYAIVGWQDATNKHITTDHARGDGETQWAAIFDACVQAAGMFPAGTLP